MQPVALALHFKVFRSLINLHRNTNSRRNTFIHHRFTLQAEIHMQALLFLQRSVRNYTRSTLACANGVDNPTDSANLHSSNLNASRISHVKSTAASPSTAECVP